MRLLGRESQEGEEGEAGEGWKSPCPTLRGKEGNIDHACQNMAWLS
jgi:hypothetical protein